MTRGLKIYAACLAVIALIIIGSVLYQPAKVRQLNALIERSTELDSYPYPFRVLKVEGVTAVISSPRSASVGVPMMIKAIDPTLEGVSIDDPRFEAAQKSLAEHQALAQQIVLSDAEITRVQWELDEGWLRARGVGF